MNIARLIYRLFLILLILSTTACGSAYYLTQASIEQWKILWNRQPISVLLADPTLEEETKKKLSLTVEARQFSKTLGLTPGDSYLTYSVINREHLSWLVVACPPDSFQLKTWWFPIVGRVPYKGFFKYSEAILQSETLKQQGYEVIIRPISAYSTLGWFNDPLTNIMLKQDAASLVALIIHESVHSTIWIPGNVDFNEQLAEFIGSYGAILFFQKKLAECREKADCEQADFNLQQSKKNLSNALILGRLITALWLELQQLYSSDKSAQLKIEERGSIFANYLEELNFHFPERQFLLKANNAEIALMATYYKNLQDLQKAFSDSGDSITKFLRYCSDGLTCKPDAVEF